jgi:hypothetical protein
LRHAGNKRGLILCHKPPYSRQRLNKCISHRWARQASSGKHKGSHFSWDERCPLMEAMPDLVISREDNPPTRTYITKPFHILYGLVEVIIVYLDYCSGLSEGIGHNVLPKITIEKKNEGVYAAWRLSSHRIASSISRAGRS